MAHTPLAGITVLDFTRILSGPYCTLLLADLGAKVIKVEMPDHGDETRSWGPPFLDDGTSAYFAALNRGKKSVALDLQSQAARDAVREMAKTADVIVENFRPGVAERLGIDHATLSSVNPALVSCSISGFGSGGAYADLPGTEIVVEAMSGLMETTGPVDGPPVRFGPAMIDIATGLTAAVRIVSALLEATQSGKGAHLECSLYSTALSAMGTLIAGYTVDGTEPTRWGSHHPSIVPYGGFPTCDGQIITGAISDRTWEEFAGVLGLDVAPEWATNAGRVENRVDVERAVSEVTQTRSTEHWVEVLRDNGLLAAPIRTIGEALKDPATRDMNIFVEIEQQPGVLSPRLDGVPNTTPRLQAVPSVGEHTAEILGALDLPLHEPLESPES
jgi:crotonobetainyl-CoA:carnitine CoA-transferase CaiB-like acyl-CoA transferase